MEQTPHARWWIFRRAQQPASGEVALTSSYTPWGDTLSVRGTGSFTLGYFGGITLAPPAHPAQFSGAGVDTATCLLYIGNGQYGVYPELVEGTPKPVVS
jgi:hypothetical protein